jgi:hypothetical protein
MSNILYIKGAAVMAHGEKRAWIMLVVSLAAYAVYAAIVLSRAAGRPLPQVPYAGLLLTTIGASIGVAIVAEIAVGIAARRDKRHQDVRDREISRTGDHVGQSFVIIGAVGGLLMALAGWDRFWIANAIYLGFVLSAALGSITRIFAYRGTFPW